MKILVITYAFGITSSGKSTKNIVKELRLLGNDVFVCTCLCEDEDIDKNILKISNPFIKPARLFSFIGDLILRDINYFFWQKKSEHHISSIIKKKGFDIIYSRGSPSVSFYIGEKLSKDFNIPLVLHFADPIPATLEWSPNKRYREKMLKSIGSSVKKADLLSFVNKEMLYYQQNSMSVELVNKSIITPNPIPISCNIRENKGMDFVVGYTGQFGKSRDPNILMKSILRVINLGFKIKLLLVGTRDVNVTTDDFKKLGDNVEILPYIENLTPVYERINLFIDIDSNFKDQVFISNKLMEYLSIDRPILCITPKLSPASNLLKELIETVYITDHSIEGIFNNLLLAIESQSKEYNYSEREKIRCNYSAKNIVQTLHSEFTKIAVN